MKTDSIRVHAPTSILFLCGGAKGPKDAPPIALRDAFHRAVGEGPGYSVVLAEDADPLTTEAGYEDLLSFESDVAQIVGAILLFAESAGSLAELGAFAASPTIAPSLIAVLDDFYYHQSSFIRNGPVKYLEVKYGEEFVHVIERDEVGIGANGELNALDGSKLASTIGPIVTERIKKRSVWAPFKSDNDGHAILLMCGLCQEFGALTLTEIREHLLHFGVQNPRLNNYLYCTILLGWLRRIRKGNHIYYAAAVSHPAINYELNTIRTARDKVRWRADIRAHWAAQDAPRMRAIKEALANEALA